jgi:hypothetical protein
LFSENNGSTDEKLVYYSGKAGQFSMFGHFGRNINSVLTCTIEAILLQADRPIWRLHDADQYITAEKYRSVL